MVSGHALHKKGSQIQKGDGPMVSSQNCKTFCTRRLNRGSNADPTRVRRRFCFSIGLHKMPVDCAPQQKFKPGVFHAVQGTIASSVNRLVGVPFGPVPPRRRGPSHADAPVLCQVLDSKSPTASRFVQQPVFACRTAAVVQQTNCEK